LKTQLFPTLGLPANAIVKSVFSLISLKALWQDNLFAA